MPHCSFTGSTVNPNALTGAGSKTQRFEFDLQYPRRKTDYEGSGVTSGPGRSAVRNDRVVPLGYSVAT